MFNKKKIQELEDRIWKLENPPKYKVMDKYMHGVVVEVIFIKSSYYSRPRWDYRVYYEQENRSYIF